MPAQQRTEGRREAAESAGYPRRGMTRIVATVVVSAAPTGQMLASAAFTPATDGTATRTLTVSGLPPAEPVIVVARGGSQQRSAALPVVSCGPTAP